MTNPLPPLTRLIRIILETLTDKRRGLTSWDPGKVVKPLPPRWPVVPQRRLK